MARIVAVFLMAVILAASPAVAAADASSDKESVPARKAEFGSLHKSLLIPGWGQAAEKRYLEAVLFFSAEVLCWAGFVDQNRRGNRSYDLYRAADNREDAVRFRRETETCDKRRNLFLLGAAGVWAANLLDIYWIVGGREAEAGGRSVSLRLDCGERQAISLALSYRY